MLYHKDVFMPKTILNGIRDRIQLRHTRHAQRAARSDRYTKHIVLPDTIKVSDYEVIEAEKTGNKTTKLVLRGPYEHEEGLDIVLVVIPDSGVLKTVWMNDSTDQHSTLRREVYATR